VTRRSRFASIAIALLATAAFGGLSVDVPLVMAQLTSPTVARLGPGISVVPAVALTYGLVSLAGAIGMWRGSRWATALVVVPQAIVALALVAVYLGQAPDRSLLIVAAIAAGTAICAMADRRLVGRT
jgi:uncharacterized membrane protein (DUF2068 family)